MLGRKGIVALASSLLLAGGMYVVGQTMAEAKPLKKKSAIESALDEANAKSAELEAKSGLGGAGDTSTAGSSARQKLLTALADGGDNTLLFQGNRIADIAEQAAPAVVNIEIQKPGSLGGSGFPFFGGGSDGMRFFYNGKEVNPQEFGQQNSRLQRGTGSGFIIRPDGYILTNVHVIKDAKKIEVTLHDGRTFIASLVGVDTFSDLAVLKIEGKELPTLKMGTSATLRPGEFAVAIGSPLGYDHTVTLGIVSAVGRTVYDINDNINFIQTDAAINQGNSGGPLLNLKGEVIGINTAVVRGNVAQNIGFSIPVDIAKSVSDDLIAHKVIHRPWLGIGMKEVTPTLAKSLGLPPTTKGVFIAQTFENSPAERSGVRQNDVIQKIDGKDVATPKEVRDYVRAKKISDVLNFLILRNGAGQSVEVHIGEYPSAVDAVPHPNEQRKEGEDPSQDE